jgi:hypothetical protein
MAAAPQTPAATAAAADHPSFGDRWAFRLFVLLFIVTLLIGLIAFLFSFLKHQAPA